MCARPHPFPATTYYIHDAIAKLRATRAASATAARYFWRGMADMGVPAPFLAQGGTEVGCMSTTEDVAVARRFAKVGERPNPLLLRVECTSLMDCGADIAWLSMYPEEREVLFPPLTYLRPVGQPVVEDGCTWLGEYSSKLQMWACKHRPAAGYNCEEEMVDGELAWVCYV